MPTRGFWRALRRWFGGVDDRVENDAWAALFGPSGGSSRLELPWRHRWDHLPKRSAGFGFSSRDYEAARERAEEIARLTLGEDLWTRIGRVGYVDVPSGRFSGVTYRL